MLPLLRIPCITKTVQPGITRSSYDLRVSIQLILSEKEACQRKSNSRILYSRQKNRSTIFPGFLTSYSILLNIFSLVLPLPNQKSRSIFLFWNFITHQAVFLKRRRKVEKEHSSAESSNRKAQILSIKIGIRAPKIL